MLRNAYGMTLALLLSAVAVMPAAAEKWLKIMPNDPFSDKGQFHQFDVDSAFQDRATGFVAAHMTYQKPAHTAQGNVKAWYVWAFDCKKNDVYYVSSPGETGTKVQDGWRAKPNTLKKSLMGGVTNMFGKKLCALKGSWPTGDLP